MTAALEPASATNGDDSFACFLVFETSITHPHNQSHAAHSRCIHHHHQPSVIMDNHHSTYHAADTDADTDADADV
ncbi:hypothetical protein CGLO_13020 [Colletotrichum gloeosporioides Cg-14]|uniref:Uncharacterized protein n=1 Tax=Colletotrichum gloeosporioides (strain Cg-14) TaxID=1237896 RepID=T0K4J7_COLGC|nr:hypothetical protein CGLO_13020 [Colletotrichum gloeosporioides Cg-14]